MRRDGGGKVPPTGLGRHVLLTVDVGNTHSVLALFRGPHVLHTWRLRTERAATPDELAMGLCDLLAYRGLSLGAVEGLAIASVVPPLGSVWAEIARTYLHCPSLIVDAETCAGLELDVERPQEVGADRIADGVAVWRLYGAPAVVVDCGTATKVDAIGAGGRYLGGVIAPGIGTASEALFRSAALLARVDLVAPPRVLGRTTAAQLQAGIVYGSAAMVDGLVDRVRAEMGGAARVVATGGFAPHVAPVSRTITEVAPQLTMHGLRLIYEARQAGGGEG